MKKQLMTLGLILALALSLMVLGGQSVSACEGGCNAAPNYVTWPVATNVPTYTMVTVPQPVQVPATPVNAPLMPNGKPAYSQMTVPVYVSPASTMTMPVLVSPMSMPRPVVQPAQPRLVNPLYGYDNYCKPCGYTPKLVLNSCSSPCFKPSCGLPWFKPCGSCIKPCSSRYYTVGDQVVSYSEVQDALLLRGYYGYTGIIIK